MAEPIVETISRFGFPDILLWMLSFAIIFGILTQTKVIKSRAANGLISIAISFLILLGAPSTLLTFLSNISGSLILVVLAILVLLVFAEAFGLKGVHPVLHPQTKKPIPGMSEKSDESVLTTHPRFFAAALGIIAILLFVSAGGLDLLGIQIPNITFNNIGVIFIASVILAVMWMIREK